MAVLCFVAVTHYDLTIAASLFIQIPPGGTDSLRLLPRKVRAPSQTRRHESALLENALSFGQLSGGPAVCVCLSGCRVPPAAGVDIRLSG